MLKQINITLYKNLLLADFGFIQSFDNLTVFYEQKASLSAQKFYYLDLFELIKGLKLLIRGLTFIKTIKKNRLVIRIANLQYCLLLKDFIKQEQLNYKIQIIHDKNVINIMSFDFTQFFFFFGSSPASLNVYKQLILNKVFLIMRVDLQKNFYSDGSYKFYTDILDIKKALFLLLLINKVTFLHK